MSEERIAPPGTIWVCAACGKTERNRYGSTGGWDESCMLHAVLCKEDSLVRDDHGYVTLADAAIVGAKP